MVKDIRTEYYNKTEEQKKRCLYYRKRTILKGENQLLKEMLAIVERDLIKYHTDFYIHDIELIKEHEGDPFLWIVRDYGTHFIYLCADDFTQLNEWGNKLYFQSILFNSGSSIKGVYLIEDNSIKQINNDTAFDVLLRYENQMRNQLKQYA